MRAASPNRAAERAAGDTSIPRGPSCRPVTIDGGIATVDAASDVRVGRELALDVNRLTDVPLTQFPTVDEADPAARRGRARTRHRISSPHDPVYRTEVVRRSGPCATAIDAHLKRRDADGGPRDRTATTPADRGGAVSHPVGHGTTSSTWAIRSRARAAREAPHRSRRRHPGRPDGLDPSATRASIGAVPSEFRTIIEPFRIHSVEPLRITTPEERHAAIVDGRIQPLRPPRRRRADRPADRLGHRCDVARSVGRDPARRRELRGLAVVVRLPRRRPGALPVHARDPDAPRAGRGEDPVLGDRRTGQGRSEQHALRHDARERRVHGRGGGRPGDPRGTTALAGASRSRATWTSRRWTRCWPSAPPTCRRSSSP